MKGFDNLLCVTEWIPFRYDGALAPQQAADAAFHIRTAQRVLETLLALTETLPLSEREQLSPTLAGDIARLEARCDLLLQLVSRLLTRFEEMPEVGEVTLCSAGVRWPAAEGSQVGDTGLLTLHLPISLQLPVIVPVRIDHLEGGEAQGSFLGADESFEDTVARMVFRRHRRAVADARQSGR